MARWQELLTMLLDPKLTTQEALARLNVRPHPAREMLAGKRLRTRLDLMRSMSEVRSAGRSGRALDEVIRRLNTLMEGDQGEVARKTCADLLEVCRRAATETPTGRKRVPLPRIVCPDGKVIDPNDF